MAFIGDFEVSQQANDNSSFTLTDVSTGSDAAIDYRTVFIYKADGQQLIPPTNWPIADATITFADLLAKDYSLNIQVIWHSTAPDSENNYIKELVTTFVGYIKNFNYTLLQQISAGNPPLQANANFGDNFYSMFMYVAGAIEATDWSDQGTAQYMISLAQYKINKQVKFF